MAKPFQLTIASVGQTLFAGEVLSVSLPGRDGVFEVLAAHEPLVAEIKPGMARLTLENGEKQEIELVGIGIAEISHSQATVLL